jgi:hypothetical protein
VFRGCLAVTRRLLRVNVLKTQGRASVAGVPSAPVSVKALRCAPTAGAAHKERAALTAASAAGGCRL